MENGFLWAGVLTIVVGVLHSVIGEALVFQPLRDHTLVPTGKGSGVSERHVRIIWASWHMVTVMGFGFAALLFHMQGFPQPMQALLREVSAVTMLTSAVLVLVGTRGKHPGWAGLLLVGVLVWWAA